jgi:hypothetical protein
MSRFIAKNGGYVSGERANSVELVLKRPSESQYYNTEDLVGAILTMYPDELAMISDKSFEKYDREIRAIVKNNKRLELTEKQANELGEKLIRIISSWVIIDIRTIRHDVYALIEKQNNGRGL